MKIRYIFAFICMFSFVTLVAWAYNKVLLEGDTSMTVPLIKAEEGPYKIPPQDPGGLNVPHQDSSIYDTLDRRTSDGEDDVEFVAPRPSQSDDVANAPLLKKGFILEQGRPAEDTKNEVESLFGDSRADAIERAKKNIEGTDIQKPFISDDDIQAVKGADRTDDLAPVEVDAGIIIDDGQNRPDTIKAPLPLPRPVREVKAEPAEKSFSDVLQSLDTGAKDSQVSEAEDIPQEIVDNASTQSDINPQDFAPLHEYVMNAKPASMAASSSSQNNVEGAEAVSVGEYYIQLASLPNEDAARKEWSILQQRYGTILGRMPVRYKTVDIEGRGRYTRIQAGPMSEETARLSCASLQEAGKSSGCIVVSD